MEVPWGALEMDDTEEPNKHFSSMRVSEVLLDIVKDLLASL